MDLFDNSATPRTSSEPRQRSLHSREEEARLAKMYPTHAGDDPKAVRRDAEGNSVYPSMQHRDTDEPRDKALSVATDPSWTDHAQELIASEEARRIRAMAAYPEMTKAQRSDGIIDESGRHVDTPAHLRAQD